MRPMGFGCAKAGSSYAQVDAIVSSVNRMGVFADVGPLPVFVSNQVCVYLCAIEEKRGSRTLI